MTEVVDVELPADKVYHSLLKYLNAQPDMKVKHCLEPSNIEIGVGS